MREGYIAGDHWKICDVCGFKIRSSQAFKRFDNLIVCEKDWEPQHPQDFVRSRKDHQGVPDPRPEGVDQFIGPLRTVLTAAAIGGDTSLTVESTARFVGGDDIGVALSSGEVVRVIVSNVPSSTSLSLEEPLPGPALSGAMVINYDAVSAADIG